MKKLIEQYYQNTYNRWRVKKEKKAAKDIVGEEYEKMRKLFWSRYGLVAKSETIAGYNADLVVRNKDNKILFIEEDKAHYVDSCFLDRFMMNAARIFQFYIDMESNESDIPFIVLSSMTKYNLYSNKFKNNKKMFSENVQRLMENKIKYFPMCEHERVTSKKYFTGPQICFNLNDSLIKKQKDFIKNVLEGVQK